jgi:hypothetical protein
MGREDLVRQLNLPKLAAHCIAANQGVVRPVLRGLFMGMRIMRRNPAIVALQFVWNLLLLITGSGVKFARRICKRFLITIRMKDVRGIDGLSNMVEASHALSRHLKENGFSFSDCVRNQNRQITR